MDIEFNGRKTYFQTSSKKVTKRIRDHAAYANKIIRLEWGKIKDIPLKEMEIKDFDLKYAAFRIKNDKAERMLLSSIAEAGIQTPLLGIETEQSRFVLIDGFKRYRCAKKLGMHIVPTTSLGNHEAAGVMQFLRETQNRNLTFMEEASLIDILRKTHGISGAEIARQLNKSQGWVSMRMGVLAEMSETVRNEILSGRFPFRAYIYGLRTFTRVKGITKKEISEFVKVTSGKGLSVNAIEQAAKNYFQGSPEIKEQIKTGNLEWLMEQLKVKEEHEPQFNEIERRVLQEMQYVDSLMQRIPHDLRDTRLTHELFFTQAYIWSENILQKMQKFVGTIKEFYDRRRKT
jgi:ParB/RepB/Spo0J family partition protein